MRAPGVLQERLDNVTRPYDKAWRRREVLLVIRAQGAKAVREKKLQVRARALDSAVPSRRGCTTYRFDSGRQALWKVAYG